MKVFTYLPIIRLKILMGARDPLKLAASCGKDEDRHDHAVPVHKYGWAISSLFQLTTSISTYTYIYPTIFNVWYIELDAMGSSQSSARRGQHESKDLHPSFTLFFPENLEVHSGAKGE